MNTLYSLSKNILVIDEKTILPTYGIIAADEKGRVISEFSDVSVNRTFTERVIMLLNECGVEPCHFFDVVLDELNR